MKNLRLMFFSFILLIGLLFLYGCFATGALVGVIIDDPKQKGTFMQKDLGLINRGNKVIVYKTNNQQVEGTYKGKVHISQQDYNKIYSQFAGNNSELNIPALGDTVKIENNQLFSSRLIKTKFCGFDMNCFYVQGIEVVNFSEVPYDSNPKLINQSESNIDFLSLKSLMGENKVPYLSAAKIKLADNMEICLPFNEISKVIMNNKRKSAKHGFFIGLGVDMIVIISLIATGAFEVGIAP